VGFRPVSWECLIPAIRSVFDPGGHTVDYLSRCYVEHMPLIAGSDILYPVRWYFTDKPPLPFSTIFFARFVWLPKEGLTRCEIEERFVVGDRGNHRTCSANAIRGPADWFMQGVPMAEPDLPILNSDCFGGFLDVSAHERMWY
jgi:hypothetical protein